MINGTCLRNAIISGANNIAKHKTSVDELNIFPVPDGDTGTNMSMTMSSAAAALEKNESDAVGQVASACASALLRGARGNSGVILSLLFRGFAQDLKELDVMDGSHIATALGIGVEAAYKAVMKPTEGTILTVARVAYEEGRAAAEENKDPVFVWTAICQGATDALRTTPELLPVLKKAGVVDAGGKGLCLIFEGMMSVFKDGYIIPNEEEEAASGAVSKPVSSDDFFRNAAAEFDQDITFTYCTEFIVGRNPEVTASPLELRAYLETIGDCVVVVDDDEIIKTHVHTENPGQALQEALKFGQLLTVKVENMKEQHRIAAEQNEQAKAKAAMETANQFEPAEPTEEIGFVSVAAGDGLQALFQDLGCSTVVSGGQTMNPSTEDILEAVLATPAKKVFVLPNNKNIIMAAQQCVDLVEDKKVIVLQAKTVPQGISAMIAMDPDGEEADNTAAMEAAMAGVTTMEVTYAARDSEFDGTAIHAGDYLLLVDNQLFGTEKNLDAALDKLAQESAQRGGEFISIFYGEGVQAGEAEGAQAKFEAACPEAEITTLEGGQPVYHYLISVE